jgi:4'-phosphopantetheinyl transferase
MPQDLPPLPNRIDLWEAVVPDQLSTRLRADYLALLSPDERDRYHRFRWERDRTRHLVARALTRVALSRYTGIAPPDLRFASNPYGCPRLADDVPHSQCTRFNLSHTEALVVLAVAADRAVGVDVERTSRPAPLEIAASAFSPAELAALHALAPAARADRFWRLWTLKESYSKARGMGLSIPPDGSTFELAGGDIHLRAVKDDDPRAWRFWHFGSDPDHLIAVCTGRGSQPEVTFARTRIMPLHDAHPPIWAPLVASACSP